MKNVSMTRCVNPDSEKLLPRERNKAQGKVCGKTLTHLAPEGRMAESLIEAKLASELRKSGGLALKFVSPGWDGMPDRIALMPGGRAAFVEVKRKGGRPRPLQIRRHEQLRRLGFLVFVLDDPAEIGGIIDEIRAS